MPLVDFGLLAALPEEFITAQEIFGDFKEYYGSGSSIILRFGEYWQHRHNPRCHVASGVVFIIDAKT